MGTYQTQMAVAQFGSLARTLRNTIIIFTCQPIQACGQKYTRWPFIAMWWWVDNSEFGFVEKLTDQVKSFIQDFAVGNKPLARLLIHQVNSQSISLLSSS